MLIGIVVAIACIAVLGVWLVARRRRSFVPPIIPVSHIQYASYHSLDSLSDEELDWLIHFYNDRIKTREYRVPGGTLVERPSEFQHQVERDLENRQLADVQIDDIDSKLWDLMNLIKPYLSDPYQKGRYDEMESMRQKLRRIKAGA